MKGALVIIGSVVWQSTMLVLCLGLGIYSAWLYTQPFSWPPFIIQAIINIVILGFILGIASLILIMFGSLIWGVLRRE